MMLLAAEATTTASRYRKVYRQTNDINKIRKLPFVFFLLSNDSHDGYDKHILYWDAG